MTAFSLAISISVLTLRELIDVAISSGGVETLSSELRDAEVEQLRQQPPGALDHHHVRRLQIAMHDAALVRGVDDLADPLEERHQLLERRAGPLSRSQRSSVVPRTSSIAIQHRPSSSTPNA